MSDAVLKNEVKEEVPSVWGRWWRWAVCTGVILAAGWVFCYPPFKLPEFAYGFLALAIYWAYLRPPLKIYLWSTIGGCVVGAGGVMGWLHNVSWLGAGVVGLGIGVWVGIWFLAVWWLMPRMARRASWERVLGMLGLAGLWVLLEWTRVYLLGGLSLSVTQWERMAILQVASYAGGWAVSFILVSMNIGLAAYAFRLMKERQSGLKKRSPEFFLALFMLVVCVSVQVTDAWNRGGFAVKLGRFAFVQPAIPAEVKWNPESVAPNLAALKELTLEAKKLRPDVILWPEAATPLSVKGHAGMRNWVEELGREVKVPVLMGSDAIERAEGAPVKEWKWFNAVFYMGKDGVVRENYYAKRKLVPFGEYVPMRFLFGWLNKVVPIGESDFSRGQGAGLLELEGMMVEVPSTGEGHVARVGSLICYEDVFPNLARESVRAGADLLVVQTNNGWFGEGGGAYQHAASSVLRAVEMRRPVLRVGNSGWSGWIDEFGSIRGVMTKDAKGRMAMVDPRKVKDAGTIYFRGVTAADVVLDSRWIGKESFYARHGDWFIGVCAVLAGLGWWWFRRVEVPKPVK